MFLADEFIEGTRTHPSGEGSRSAHGLFFRLLGRLKQILHNLKNTKREWRRTLYSRPCERPSWLSHSFSFRSASRTRNRVCHSGLSSRAVTDSTVWWRKRKRGTGRHFRLGNGRRRSVVRSSGRVTNRLPS